MKNVISRLASMLLGLVLIMGVAAPAQAAFPNKYHPGHYMLTYFGATELNAFEPIINNPNFVGVQKRYKWRTLEPARGKYDFSMIIRDLNYLRSLPMPKRLIIQVTVTGDEKGLPHAPDYLRTPEFDGGVYTSTFPVRYVRTKQWNTAVQDRLIALFRALGARFDKEPYFEGVVLDETATGIRLHQWTAANYTAEKAYNGHKRIMAGLKAAFPNTMCIQFINFFSGANAKDGLNKIAGLIQYAHQIGMGIGGPDIHVGGTEPSYPYFTTYNGSMPLTAAVQWEDYGWVSPTGNVATVPQIFDFARNKLHLNYIFWLQREPYFSTQVVPLVRRMGAP